MRNRSLIFQKFVYMIFPTKFFCGRCTIFWQNFECLRNSWFQISIFVYQDAIRAIMNDPAHIFDIVRYHRLSARHRFQIHKPERICFGRENKYIHTAINICQFLSSFNSQKCHILEFFREIFFFWTIAHDDFFVFFRDFKKFFNIFFDGNASDKKRDWPSFVQEKFFCARKKHRMVDSKRNHGIISIIIIFNIRNHPMIWNKNFFRAVVNIMQILMHIFLFEKPISHAQIFGEFGMKRRCIRNFIFFTNECRRKTNRPFRFDMNEIWPNFVDFFKNLSRKTEWKSNFFVSKKRHTEKIICRNNCELDMIGKVFFEVFNWPSDAIDLLRSRICKNKKRFFHTIFSKY